MDSLIADFKKKDISTTEKLIIEKNNDCNNSNNNNIPLIKRLDRGTLPIIYKEGIFLTDREGNTILPGNAKNIPGNATKVPENVYPIPRLVLINYLNEVVIMMSQDSNINEIVESSWNTKTPLHSQSMEFQRDVMVRMHIYIHAYT